MVTRPFRVRAPGRVCFFGEHSDYLGLEVIPGAIDLCIEIVANPREDREIHVNYSDLGTHDAFSIATILEPRHRRDYLRSAFNVMARRGISPAHGWDLQVSGNIPVAGGLSSSSALTVAAVMTVAQMANKQTRPAETAQAAYEAEVLEFGESGGMMDHFASAFGGLIHLDCGNNNALTRLPAMIHGVVIGDSKEKKADTVGDLRAIRSAAEEGYRLLARRIRGFDNRRTPVEKVLREAEVLPDSCRKVVITTILNRDLTRRALKLLSHPQPDPPALGELIDEHHRLLRDGLNRSTDKIERMIAAAKKAGALGCKINGSGGGGTMMAYAPDNEKEVSRAIESEGGTVHVTRVGEGASVTTMRE